MTFAPGCRGYLANGFAAVRKGTIHRVRERLCQRSGARDVARLSYVMENHAIRLLRTHDHFGFSVNVYTCYPIALHDL